MTLYLIEVNNEGYPLQFVTVDDELENFKDSTAFKAFTDYAEAQDKLGKRWTGSLWEEVEHKPSKPAPEIPDPSMALLEGLASLAEKVEKLENNQVTIMEGLAVIEEEKKP